MTDEIDITEVHDLPVKKALTQLLVAASQSERGHVADVGQAPATNVMKSRRCIRPLIDASEMRAGYQFGMPIAWQMLRRKVPTRRSSA